jgi:hypothetical protein
LIFRLKIKVKSCFILFNCLDECYSKFEKLLLTYNMQSRSKTINQTFVKRTMRILLIEMIAKQKLRLRKLINIIIKIKINGNKKTNKQTNQKKRKLIFCCLIFLLIFPFDFFFLVSSLTLFFIYLLQFFPPSKWEKNRVFFCYYILSLLLLLSGFN